MLKNILIIILLALLVIQFIHPKKNEGNNRENDISKAFTVPDPVSQILSKSCYDCHSNKTNYPWYATLQPVHWWLQDHINDGKKDLNFSEFAAYRPYRQYKKMEELIELVKEEEMPLPSYLYLHRDAKLNESQKLTLANWAEGIRDSLQARYPADSLKRPNKK